MRRSRLWNRIPVFLIRKCKYQPPHISWPFYFFLLITEANTKLPPLYSLFLYLFLAAIFGGTCYFIYSTWISTLFPQKRRPTGGKDASRARKSTAGSKGVDPGDQVSVLGADGPAVTSGAAAKAYDESWIPAGHLQRPDARRVKSGARPKSRNG